MFKVLIWGLGRCYNIMKNSISYFECNSQLEVVAIVSKDAYMTKLDGYPVIGADRISEYEWDWILVMSDNSFYAIVNDATNNYNIERNKLIPYRVLQIPNISLDKYFKLKESNISIISNNCWGGIMYYTLGLECLSPFKNLFLRDEDYLRIIQDLERYMNMEPQFSHYEIEPHSGIPYPVLQLDDLEIHCNHTTDSDVAIRDWNRRKKKINYDNLYIEMYTTDRGVAQKFAESTRQYNGVGFVPWVSNDEKLITLEVAPGLEEFWEAVNRNASLNTYGLKYSLIDLLFGNVVFRY